MMASIIPPNFTPHPGAMQQHPPPHMAPGMAHNPSQPGVAPGGIPHGLVGHMGVSGPGPQMNPAALMGGMPPGVGNPNAHAALHHLNPQAQQMFQAQQHMNPMRNPSIQQQMAQQRQLQVLQQQQQQRQAMMAQQAASIQGMPGMPMGVPMNQQAAAAYQAQLRRMGAPVPPLHLQQQQLQQIQQQNPGMNPAMVAQHLAQQQQQLQQMNQMNQAANNPNQHPMNPQFMQQAQMAALSQQHAAAHAAQAQAQAHAAHAQQQAQGQGQAQQAQQGQAQAQQAQQAQQQQSQQGQPQAQTPQPQQQQVQGGPGTNGPGPNQVPTQNPTPQPNPQQQPQAPPQTPQTTQAQQQQAAQLAHAQQQAVQQATGVANMMQQKRLDGLNLKGVCLLKLMQFNEHLSGFPGSKGKEEDRNYWNAFVQQFFSQKGIFRHGMIVRDKDNSLQEKQYEIAYPALARYFHTHFESGVKTMHLIMEKGTTDRPMPGDSHWIECNKASLQYVFESGTQVVAHGTLRASFDHEQKFELFEFLTTSYEELMSRDMVIQAARPAHNWVKEWKALNQQDSKQSPEMSKKGKAKPMKSPPNPPPDIDLPVSAVKTGMGITEAVFQFLEIVEIMGQMNPLFTFYHNHPGLTPYGAVEQYVNQVHANQGVNGPVMPPRTPSFQQYQMGNSPAMPAGVLPGSPHIGSPAPGQMQAPGMQLQASQQGTNSSGPSANTSPSQNNKRRRASAVKEEDTPASAPTPSAIGTPQMNGVPPKVKQPPTPRMAKRLKGNPGA